MIEIAQADTRPDFRKAALKVQKEYRRHGVECSLESCRQRIARQVYYHDLMPQDAAEAMVDGIAATAHAGGDLLNLYPE